jgi:hypothetical protein
MNEEQLDALKKVVYYLAEEQEHYETYVVMGGEPTKHIYHAVLVLKQLTEEPSKC